MNVSSVGVHPQGIPGGPEEPHSCLLCKDIALPIKRLLGPIYISSYECVYVCNACKHVYIYRFIYFTVTQLPHPGARVAKKYLGGRFCQLKSACELLIYKNKDGKREKY